MRIHVLSDLHLEQSGVELPTVDADVVVLAGDTAHGVDGVRWAADTFPDTPVLYLLGNHEYFDLPVAEAVEALRTAARGTTVTILENNAATIAGVAFLGCTLWSDFRQLGNKEESARIAQEELGDFRRIKLDAIGTPFTVADWLQRHQESIDWLSREIGRHNDGPLVVLTHFAPSSRSVDRRYGESPLQPAFSSSLDSLIKSSAARLWIHGHLHKCFDFTVGATRVLCNPQGYPPHVDDAFDPALVVEV